MTEHINSAAKDSDRFKPDVKSEFESYNPESTNDHQLKDPGPEEIRMKMPLIVAMACENRYSPNCKDVIYDDWIDGVFDEALCDVANDALQRVGLEDTELSIYKIRALMIKHARGIDHYSQLESYIAKYSDEEIEQLGLKQDYEKSSYRKAAKKLKESGRFDKLQEATFWAVHVIFYNGVITPSPVSERYNLNYTDGPAADDFGNDSQLYAKYNLGEEITEIIVDNLDFGRADNKSRSIRTLLGIFAHSAKENLSHENYEDSAQHIFDLSDAYAGSSIGSLVGNLDLYEVEEMFRDINICLLQYAWEKQVISEPVIISVDLTNIQALAKDTVNEEFTTEDGRWRFLSVSITDPSFDFAFGVRLLVSESQRSEYITDFIRDLKSNVELKLLLADRGFDGVRDIEEFRAEMNEGFLVHAQDQEGNTKFESDVAKIRKKLGPQRTAVLSEAGYEELEPPVRMIAYSGSPDADEIDPVRSFLTGISFSEDQEQRNKEITDLNFTYNTRAKIETQFRMGKNILNVGGDSNSPVKKSFYFHMALLFYNVYQLFNNVPGPETGVELSVSQREVLTILKVLGFGGVQRSEVLEYHFEGD